MDVQVATNPIRSSLARTSPLIAVVLLMIGCGGSMGSSPSTDSATTATSEPSAVPDAGDSAAQARVKARGVAQDFLDSLTGQDAAAFCEVTLPEIQQSNFASSHIPPGSCEERAQAMFVAPRADGTIPFWAAGAQAVIGAVEVNCAGAGGRCDAATVELENLPLRGGGTTRAPLPVSLVGGRWLVGVG
jgi:hypothetical protein